MNVPVEVRMELAMVTILVVDADENARRLYGRLFGREGFRVLVAGTKEEVAEMAADSRIDLAVLDFNVPGLRLMDHVPLFWNRDIPVIVHTGDDDPQEDIPSWLPEAWLTKTGDMSHLRRAVVEALEKKVEREIASFRKEVPALLPELGMLMFDDMMLF